MQIFDAHCDTATELFKRREKLGSNSLHIDLDKLSRYDSFTQVFAVFISPEHRENAMEYALAVIENFKKEAKENEVRICCSYNDYERSGTRVKAFLSLEGGEPITEICDVKRLYKKGIRIIAPTWNFSNKIACGVMEDCDSGLSAFGRQVIAEMNRLGIILDVSHLGEKSFQEASELTKLPIIASHSNLRSVKNHRRNLSCEQFLRIKKSNGVCGINIYPPFFGDDISCLKDHIDAFLALGGEDNVGLGCDFDGVDALPVGISDVSGLSDVIRGLPYSTKIREKLAYRNFSRVIKALNC